MLKNTYLILVFSVLIFGSCKKTETAAISIKTVTASLSGSNHIPPVTTSATGSVTGTYNTGTKILTFTLTFTGVVPTAGHIHDGAAGTTGPVVLPFNGTLASPYTYTSPALTSAEEAELLAGNYYVNIHSAANPSGEIRGQLSVQ